jgi:hypothetical protein
MKDRKTIKLAFENGSVRFLYPVSSDSRNILIKEFGGHFVDTMNLDDLPEIVDIFDVLIVD